MIQYILPITLLLTFLTPTAYAGDILFDAENRRAEITQYTYASAREACLAPTLTLGDTPFPIPALKRTIEYGSDNRSQPFAWHVMILGGRTLAGDEKANAALKDLIYHWAQAKAFIKTEKHYDPHYALKRTLLPLIINYSLIANELDAQKRDEIDSWLDALVRSINVTYGGDVDRNNHATLRDSVIMAWGAYRNDKALLKQGKEGFVQALSHMRDDGSLPLETRRGARAIWYMRHTLTSLAVIDAIALMRNDTLWEEDIGDNKYASNALHFMLNAISSPLTILPYAAENTIPGKEDDYFKQEIKGLFAPRGHGRNYMAFAELLMRNHPENFSVQRLAQMMQIRAASFRPFIDEYAGGNATCFFWQPPVEAVNE